MKIKPRHMRKYAPRRRRSNKALLKQQLKDIEHLLEMDLNTFLVLLEEGNPKQIQNAKAKVRSDLLKYGSDMDAISRDLGEGYPEIVREYLKGINQILQNASTDVDPAILNEHRKIAMKINQAA